MDGSKEALIHYQMPINLWQTAKTDCCVFKNIKILQADYYFLISIHVAVFYYRLEHTADSRIYISVFNKEFGRKLEVLGIPLINTAMRGTDAEQGTTETGCRIKAGRGSVRKSYRDA